MWVISQDPHQKESPPVWWFPMGSKRSKVAVAPSTMGRYFRTPLGWGALTLPSFPYSAVCRCPLLPHSKGGMYLENTKVTPCIFRYVAFRDTEIACYSEQRLRRFKRDCSTNSHPATRFAYKAFLGSCWTSASCSQHQKFTSGCGGVVGHVVGSYAEHVRWHLCRSYSRCRSQDSLYNIPVTNVFSVVAYWESS